jgi:predicted Zn-dependent protease
VLARKGSHDRHYLMNTLQRTIVSALLSAIAILAGQAAPLLAQRPRGKAEQFVPDPSVMLEQFFGGNREEDGKALAEMKVSKKEEEELGHAAVQSFLDYLRQQNVPVVSRGKDVDYLKRLVETMRPKMKQAERFRTITIYVAESPRPDARSLPGGTLIFFRGLLDSAESEAALVGVIGHELSHLDRDHLLVNLRRMKLARQTFSNQNGFSPENFFNAGAAMMRLWSRPFRPEDERTADLDGARWAYEAGYDPREMVRVIAKIGAREKNESLNFLPSYFRTHPPAEERSKAVQELYNELQKKSPNDELYIGKENLRRRITRVEKEFKK